MDTPFRFRCIQRLSQSSLLFHLPQVFPNRTGLGRCHYNGGTTASASASAAAGRALTTSEGIGSTVSHCDFDLNLLAFPNFNKFFVQTISLLFIVLLLPFEHRGHGGGVVMLAAAKDSHGGGVVVG
ncbi:hypothetical protein PIB30_064695 [Stylosanthes scabra]|uniref:Uncharacterized protein n=1 Tax=Stylosanthes scabra TaxID=79078 RepID=A0ABU6YKJ6_9FABA|nr:hypothetical protein [Stylosanthes scabra]